MDRNEWLDALVEAQEKLGEVIETLEMYARETNDSNMEAYIIASLKTWAGGYGYGPGHNIVLQDIIEELSKPDPEGFCELCGAELFDVFEQRSGVCESCYEHEEEHIAKSEKEACR
jgi:hypothetical protein